MKIANAIKFTPKLNLQERSKIIFSVDEADTNFPIFNKIDNVIICKGSTHKKMRTLTFSVLAELLRMKETDENGMYQFMLNQMRTYAQSMKNSAKIKTSTSSVQKSKKRTLEDMENLKNLPIHRYIDPPKPPARRHKK
jgi:hypothetical protein